MIDLYDLLSETGRKVPPADPDQDPHDPWETYPK